MAALASVFLARGKSVSDSGPSRSTRGRGARVSSRRCPPTAIAPLVDREALGGAYFLLTFRHPETAREARPGQFVMIKAGALRRAPAAPPLLDPVGGRGAGDLHPVREGDRPGLAGPVRDGARRRRPVPRPPRPAVHAAARGRRGAPRRRRLRRRALPLPRRGARGARAGRRGSSTAGARRPTCPSSTASARLGLTLVPATEDGSLGERGRVTVPLEAHLDAADGPGAPLRLRPRRDDARGRPHRGRALARRRGQPRPLDGLRHRHLPRLRRARAGRGRAALEVPLRVHGGPGLRLGPRGVAGRGGLASPPRGERGEEGRP